MHDEHAWERGAVLWDVYYGVVLAGTLVSVQIEPDGTVLQRTVATTALLLMVPWHVVMAGRVQRGRDKDDRASLPYVAGLFALLIMAETTMSTSSFVLFAVAPVMFRVLSKWWALLAVTLSNAVPMLAITVSSGHRAPSYIVIALVVGGLVFSSVLGRWIEVIIRQSNERADLIRELESTRAELAEAHHTAGQLAERERLGGEIHDTLAQGFTSIGMLLRAIEPRITDAEALRMLDLARSTASENLAESRAMIVALPPASLGCASLDQAIRDATARLGEEIGIAAGYECEGAPRILRIGTEVVLLRVAQEALANTRKHAAARQVTVRLAYGMDVSLTVTDNGVGFDLGRPDGFGLRNMRGRVERAGGTLTVDSGPSTGTTIVATLPTSEMMAT